MTSLSAIFRHDLSGTAVRPTLPDLPGTTPGRFSAVRTGSPASRGRGGMCSSLMARDWVGIHHGHAPGASNQHFMNAGDRTWACQECKLVPQTPAPTPCSARRTATRRATAGRASRRRPVWKPLFRAGELRRLSGQPPAGDRYRTVQGWGRISWDFNWKPATCREGNSHRDNGPMDHVFF